MRWFILVVLLAGPVSAGFDNLDCASLTDIPLEGPEKTFCECSQIEKHIERLQCYDDATRSGVDYSRANCRFERIASDPNCTAASDIMTDAAECSAQNSLSRLACFDEISKYEKLTASYFLRSLREIANDHHGRKALQRLINDLE